MKTPARSIVRTRWIPTVASALILLSATPALGYVLELEPPAASDSSGTADEPFPQASAIGGPDTSRAVYGYLAGSEEFDAYAFEVDENVTSRLTILVPSDATSADFRPEATVFSGTEVVASLEDPGSADREEYFDTFAGMSFLKGGSALLEFEPGTRYVMTIGPGSGTMTSGSYVALMSGPDRFQLAEVLDVPRVYLGLYGQSPFRWDVATAWTLGVALLAGLALIRRRRIAGPRADPRDIFGL